ncbi:MAG: signal peptidase II [Lentisphaerae bacterium GWF2_45_14]|nr:MAG: signal peptidase II [Lentisphaerae bacterium GWF2_45_14]
MFLAAFLVVLDQLSKIVVVQYIPKHDVIPVIGGFFNLTYITNPGAAWGIMSGKGHLLLGVSIAVLIMVIYFLRSLTEGCVERYFALFMIVSGIIGNSIDRLWRQEVVDFLDFYFGTYHWPSFNVADSSITIGVTIYIISSLLRSQKKKAEYVTRPGAWK